MSTINWENALGGNWSIGTNWELGLVPASTDDVQILLPGTYTVSIASPVSANSLMINATGGTLDKSSAGSLSIELISLYAGAVYLNAANAIQNVDVEGGLLAVGDSGALTGFLYLGGGELLATTTERLPAILQFGPTPTIAVATGQTLLLVDRSI